MPTTIDWQEAEKDPRVKRMLLGGSITMWARAVELFRYRVLQGETDEDVLIDAVMFLQSLRTLREVARAAELFLGKPGEVTAAIQAFGRGVPHLEDVRGFATYHAEYVAGHGRPIRGAIPAGWELRLHRTQPAGPRQRAVALTIENNRTGQQVEVVAASGAARALADAISAALR